MSPIVRVLLFEQIGKCTEVLSPAVCVPAGTRLGLA